MLFRSQELIKQKFAEWIWKDIDRRELLCRIYNETFNGSRPREYDGRHIRFEGMNPEISLRDVYKRQRKGGATDGDTI